MTSRLAFPVIALTLLLATSALAMTDTVRDLCHHSYPSPRQQIFKAYAVVAAEPAPIVTYPPRRIDGAPVAPVPPIKMVELAR